MKLTAAIAHSYPNAEVRFMDIDNIDKVAKMNGIVKDTVHLGIPCNLISLPIEHKFISVEYCQLILTPLDKISDEDAVEVAKIILSKDASYTPLAIERNEYYTQLNIKSEPDITDADTIVNMYIRIWNEDCNIQWVWEYCKNNHIGVDNRHVPNVLSAYDYLRSKNYDCGFMSIGSLIKEGIAIAKE